MPLEPIHYVLVGLLILAPVLLIVDIPWTDPARHERVGLAAAWFICLGNVLLELDTMGVVDHGGTLHDIGVGVTVGSLIVGMYLLYRSISLRRNESATGVSSK